MNYIVHGKIRIIRHHFVVGLWRASQQIVLYMERWGTMRMVRREICRWVSKLYKPMNVHAKNSASMAKNYYNIVYLHLPVFSYTTGLNAAL